MNELKPGNVVLAEIEALQDDVLRQLDALNVRIERTLKEYGGVVADAVGEQQAASAPSADLQKAA